jgi:hypothetical protein
MGLRADPPDFLHEGSMDLTDYRSSGRKLIGMALGAVLAVAAFSVGAPFGQDLANWFRSTFLGVQTDNDTANTILGRLD